MTPLEHIYLKNGVCEKKLHKGSLQCILVILCSHRQIHVAHLSGAPKKMMFFFAQLTPLMSRIGNTYVRSCFTLRIYNADFRTMLQQYCNDSHRSWSSSTVQWCVACSVDVVNHGVGAGCQQNIQCHHPEEEVFRHEVKNIVIIVIAMKQISSGTQ